MTYFDAHAHCIKSQSGGILIGLEGEKEFDGFMNNMDVEVASSIDSNFLPCYYILKNRNEVPSETLLKYHPRREKYTSDEVIADLKTRSCKLCVIDTLNQPYWSYLDYWKVVMSFPKVFFILSHMGGYDIVDFVKLMDFNPNVYGDFSMTQEFFGWCGERARFATVVDCIDYCIVSKRLNNRILFGSDEPDFSQVIALNKYLTLSNAEDILVNNYLRLINEL